ncbi:MAG: RDD family protein [Actinobacteria bacterium]|nr:RDD family protein [Actinomycetota bacterium]
MQRSADSAGRPFADWWHRAAARLLDAVFVFMLVALVLGMLSSSGILPGYTVEKVNQATGQVQLLHQVSALGWIVAAFIASLIWLAYFALLDGSQSGHTIGKQALGLRVRDIDSGDQLGAARALLRELVILVCFWAFILPLLLDAISPLWDSRRRAWHDKLAGSVVVEEISSLSRQSNARDPRYRRPPW